MVKTVDAERLSITWTMKRRMIFGWPSALLVAAVFLSTPWILHAFSAEARQQRQFIELVKAVSLPNDRLPASFIGNWPTWVLNEDSSWTKIPDDDGFVAPTSVDELWQPVDLKSPQCKLAVGLHVRDGTIRHVLPAVDLTLDDNQHRNRGLCSVPRAYQWMDFASLALGGGLDVCKLVLQSRAKEETTWSTIDLLESVVHQSINRAVDALCDNPPADLAQGSCVINVLCENAIPQELPKVGSEMRALLLEEDGTTLGALEVTVAATAAGSESDYLPEAYKPLFGDESLRRPAYAEMKRRMHQNNNSESREQ